MLRIVLFILFTQNYIVFSKNESISGVQNLVQNYSYEDEMQFKRKGEKYGIIDNLEKLLLNDSVFKNFTKNELINICTTFLKKRALGMHKKVNAEYFCNMRLWPSDLISFSINIVTLVEYDSNTFVKEYINIYSDYVSIKILSESETSLIKKLDIEFKNMVRNMKCKN